MEKLRIRELREAKEMSQSELGRLIGVSTVTICLWERGRNNPKTSRLPALANALGVPISELFAPEKGEAS